ncbi:MAG TPA: Ig domain-containing protein, partial [Candidatus Acidoferrum sp.]|nr:Ig domain-containing protein [Candidatus Acidoferrum sp.]
FNLAISMGPLHVAPATLPAAMQNAPYNAPLQALGGQPPYAWSLEPGSAPLPLGLSLAPDGTVSGLPCAAGTSYFLVNVTDALDSTTNQEIAMTVNASSLPQVISITGLAVLANGQFQFAIPAVAGTNYTILVSTDLATWTPILTFAGSGMLQTIVDPNAAGTSRRFYRVRVER